MGLWGKVVELVRGASAPNFGLDVDSGTLYGTPTIDDYIRQTGPITRAEALRVPAVKRARDIICALSQFPLVVIDPDGKPATLFTPNLFQQPEAGIAPSVTWARVVEDMFFGERSWLKVTNLGWHGRPIQCHRFISSSVTVQPQYLYYPEGSVQVWPEIDGLIRIDSPNEGILKSAPAIRACIALERAALNAADGAPPVDYFRPAKDANITLKPEEIEDILTDWDDARHDRSTGYIPSELDYVIAGWDPEKLQLAEQREFAITEVGRATGIDAEDLSVHTTSRTYFNGQDRRRVRLEDVLGPYMTAIEGRLSMNDVTPYGYTVRFDTAAYLRLDDLAAAQTDEVLIRSKVLTPDEARTKRGLEPLGEQAPTVQPTQPAEQEDPVHA